MQMHEFDTTGSVRLPGHTVGRTWNSFSPFVQGYIFALFESSMGVFEAAGTAPAFADLAPEAVQRIELDCARFLADGGTPNIELAAWHSRDCDHEKAGRALWYTRNDLGDGFRAAPWPPQYRGGLVQAAVSMGMCLADLGENGRVYLDF